VARGAEALTPIFLPAPGTFPDVSSALSTQTEVFQTTGAGTP
jgi:hypothetical protein